MNFAHRLNDGRVGIRRVRHLTTVPQGSIEERCDTLYRPKPIRHASSYRECHSPRLRYAPRRPGFGAAASASAATSSMLQSRAATPAVMAGVTRRLLWMRQKLYQTKYSARAWQCTLRSCRAAMGSDGRLLVVDQILQPDPSQERQTDYLVDMQIMAMLAASTSVPRPSSGPADAGGFRVAPHARHRIPVSLLEAASR